MKKIFYLIPFFVLLFGCENSYIEQSKPNEVNYLEPLILVSDSELKTSGFPQQKEAIIDLHIILETILRNQDVSKELYYLGRTHYYSDYYMSLEDLLFPENSGLYEKANLTQDLQGSFKTTFENELQKHPEMVNLKAYVSSLPTVDNNVMNTTNNDDGTELYIYCPYCLDVPEEQTAEPSIVPTMVDAADEAIGNKLLEDGTTVGVMTNDDYASENLTYIVTTSDDVFTVPCDNWDPDCGGENPGGGGSNPPSGGTYNGIQSPDDIVAGTNWPHHNDDYDIICQEGLINRVFVGDMKVKKQYDPWIGFNNSGGSEMRVMRIDGFLQTLENGDIVTDMAEAVITKFYKRKWINDKDWKSWNAHWDPNWECDNTEQMFVIYEEDNNVEKSFNVSLTTVFTVAGIQTTATGTYAATVPTEDDLIRTWRMDGETFFRTNLEDNACGLRSHPNYQFIDYAIYDCGTDVEYTLPHNYYD